jgi:hypothetical protein
MSASQFRDQVAVILNYGISGVVGIAGAGERSMASGQVLPLKGAARLKGPSELRV